MFTAWKASAAKVGINLDIHISEWAPAWAEAHIADKTQAQDIFGWWIRPLWTYSGDMFITFLAPNGDLNISYYDDPSLAAGAEDAASLLAQGKDAEARAELIALQVKMREQCPIIPLNNLVMRYAAGPRVAGYVPNQYYVDQPHVYWLTRVE